MYDEKVVAHLKDGDLDKGWLEKLSSDGSSVEITSLKDNKKKRIEIEKAKAVFFVREFDGDSAYNEEKHFEKEVPDDAVTVIFKDEERVVGRERRDFGKSILIEPPDKNSNNEEILIPKSSTERIIEEGKPSARPEVELLDLIEKSDLELLLETISERFNIVIQSLDGTVISGKRIDLPYCRNFRGKRGGWYCDEIKQRIPFEEDKVVHHKCWGGIVYPIVPIIIAGMNIANISWCKRRSETLSKDLIFLSPLHSISCSLQTGQVSPYIT